jgi:hypothetical protein
MSKILNVAVVALAYAAAPAAAAAFVDPAGDFLASFTGPHNADLDVLSGSATYNDNELFLSLTLGGVPGSTAGSSFLWGVDRGSGTNRLITSGPPTVGPSTVLLDAVVRFDFDGNGRVVTFPVAGAPTTVLLSPSVVTISGNTISGRIPRALLPSTGFGFGSYTYIAWSRSALGSQALIADLAPGDASVSAGAVPEPASWALMIAGFGLTGALARRSRVATGAG